MCQNLISSLILITDLFQQESQSLQTSVSKIFEFTDVGICLFLDMYRVKVDWTRVGACPKNVLKIQFLIALTCLGILLAVGRYCGNLFSVVIPRTEMSW